MSSKILVDYENDTANEAFLIAEKTSEIIQNLTYMGGPEQVSGEPFLFLFTIFVLAVFIGFYVVWSVTPALHSPLMSVTNAISSVIIVGGLIAAGPAGYDFSKVMGFIAIVLASINIFGGFIVTQRMLTMFKKKHKKMSQ